jgi:hypothetical protein
MAQARTSCKVQMQFRKPMQVRPRPSHSSLITGVKGVMALSEFMNIRANVHLPSAGF